MTFGPLPLPSRLLHVADPGHSSDLPALVARARAAGVTFVELRRAGTSGGARWGSRERLAEIRRAQEQAGEVELLVNDRVDLAAVAGTAGAHVGQEDLPVAEARRILGPAALLGLSTHERGQVEAARGLPLDYVAVGPVFASSTKSGHAPPLGLPGVRACRGAADRPLVAIGGITADNAAAVLAAGADAVAVAAGLSLGPLEANAERLLRAVGPPPVPAASSRPVLLTGFSGAGKSTVGRLAAQRLGWDFVDLDDVLAGGGASSDLLDRVGEAAFRRLEADALARIVRAPGGRILVALGGGTLEGRLSRGIAERSGLIAWLDADLATCLGRLDRSPERRPLLEQARRTGEGAVPALFDSRRARYGTARLRVPAGGTPAEAAAALVAGLHDTGAVLP